jgi:hypothetical protein
MFAPRATHLRQPLADDGIPVATPAKEMRLLASASGSLLPPTPTGEFRDGLFDCLSNIVPTCVVGWCVPPILAAQVS